MANNLNTTTNGFNGLNIAEQVGSRAKPNGSLKILIIDDIEDLAQIMCELVCLLGHEATFAYNGTDGIAIAKEFRPQVIICDIGLPGLSGYEVADLIRKDPELQDAILVALSGYARPEDIKRSKDAGFARHLGKPISIETIQQVLDEVARCKCNDSG